MENLFFNNEVRNVIAGFLVDDFERNSATIAELASDVASPKHLPTYATFLDYCKGLARKGIIHQRVIDSEGFDHLHPVLREYLFSMTPGMMRHKHVARLVLKFAVEHDRSMFELLGKGGAKKGASSSTVARLLALSALLESPLTCSEISRKTGMNRNSMSSNLEEMTRAGLVEKPPEKSRKNVYRLVRSPLEFLEEQARLPVYASAIKNHIVNKLIEAAKNGFSPGDKYEEFSLTEMDKITEGVGTPTGLKSWMKKLESGGYSVRVSSAFKKQKRTLTELGKSLGEMLQTAMDAMADDSCAAALGERMDDFFSEKAVRESYCADGFRIYYTRASIYTKQGVGDDIREKAFELATANSTFTANEFLDSMSCNKGTLSCVLKGMVADGTLGKELVGRQNHYFLQ